MPETRSIEQQLTDAIVAAINAAPDLPDVEVDRSWDVEPEEIGTLGTIVLIAQSSGPLERQQLDDPADERSLVVVFGIWAGSRARADAIRARIQQLVCFCAPAPSGSAFFQLAKRIRPGTWNLQTQRSGRALGELQLHPDTKQTVTDPTRWN